MRVNGGESALLPSHGDNFAIAMVATVGVNIPRQLSIAYTCHLRQVHTISGG